MFKKIAVTLLATVGLVAYTHGQGTVNFDNGQNYTLTADSAVRDAVAFGGLLLGDTNGAGGFGTNFYAQLFAAPGIGANQDDMVPIGKPVYFRSGANAGYCRPRAPTTCGAPAL